jgi:hypothetical protein
MQAGGKEFAVAVVKVAPSGRAGLICVRCTWHRHACNILDRQADRELVDSLPPAAPLYPGAQLGRMLRGGSATNIRGTQDLRIAIR